MAWPLAIIHMLKMVKHTCPLILRTLPFFKAARFGLLAPIPNSHITVPRHISGPKAPYWGATPLYDLFKMARGVGFSWLNHPKSGSSEQQENGITSLPQAETKPKDILFCPIVHCIVWCLGFQEILWQPLFATNTIQSILSYAYKEILLLKDGGVGNLILIQCFPLWRHKT